MNKVEEERKEARRTILENCISDEVLTQEEEAILGFGGMAIDPIHFLSRGTEDSVGIYMGTLLNGRPLNAAVRGKEVTLDMYEEIKDEYLLSPVIEKMIDCLTNSYNKTIKREDIGFIEMDLNNLQNLVGCVYDFIHAGNDNIDPCLNEMTYLISMLATYKLDAQTYPLLVTLIPVFKETIIHTTSNMYDDYALEASGKMLFHTTPVNESELN